MKLKIILIAALAVIFSGSALPTFAQTNAPSTDRKILYYTCPMHPSVKSDKPGNCPYCGMNLEAVYTDDAATNTSSSATNSAAVKPYPLDYCLVSGDKIGSMGKPIVVDYQGQEFKFCCPDCPAQFKKDPDQYVKKLSAAEAAAKQ